MVCRLVFSLVLQYVLQCGLPFSVQSCAVVGNAGCVVECVALVFDF